MAYTPKSFAVAVLKGLGMPVTPGNVRALVGWEKAEGGHWHNSAHFNPLNTTQPEPGAGNTGTQGNIKVYRSPQQGVQATVQTLKNGHYANILAAFANGHNPGAVARAIGQSPWGTSGDLVARTIGSTAAPGHIPAGNVSTGSTGTRTTTRTTSVTPDAQQAQRAALAQFVLSNRPDPLALAENYAALGQQTQTQTSTRVRTTGGGASSTSAPSSGGNFAKGHSPLKELFWQGAGGIDAKNGVKEPQGFVSGHTDHVHVAAGPKTVVELGHLAQQKFGLHVGENPHFGGVHPVHVTNSFHYKGEAIDVSGPPDRMRAFAHYVASLYGIK